MNLLVVFDAVMRAGSVTRAAKQLRLSQSATSSALARLREVIGDPLLIRSPHGMVATPRAEELAGPLRDALAGIERALAREDVFDPKAATRVFVMRATDYVQSVVVPPLLAQWAESAPGVRLNARAPTGAIPTAELVSGELDVVCARWDEAPAGFLRQQLIADRFVTVLRAGHPAAEGKLTLQRYAELEHVVVSIRGDMAGSIDQTLEELGVRRRIAVAVPYFHLAFALVAAGDYVATVPKRLARVFAAQFALKHFDPPLPLPGISIFQFWHERTDKSAEHRWFRACLRQAAEAGR